MIGGVAGVLACFGALAIISQVLDSPLEQLDYKPGAPDVLDRPIGAWTISYIVTVVFDLIGFILAAIVNLIVRVIRHVLFVPVLAAGVIAWLCFRSSEGKGK